MNVVYASNDNYARHLAVSLVSLLEHNQSMEQIHIYLLSVQMSKQCRQKLKSITRRFGRELFVVELGDLKSRFSYEIDTRGFDISALSRLFIAQMLPDGLERVLYLDCDTVVLQPLKKLWETDLQGQILGAVMEPTIYPCIKQQIGLACDQAYYNSGVLLIDFARWKKEGVEKQLLDFYQSCGGRLFACDQDTINGALKGRIYPLKPCYNFFTNYRYFHYKELVKLSSSYEIVSREEFRKAMHHPSILHYMGDERPWKAGNLNHYRRAYERYLNLTPWKGTPKEKGARLYMLAYHMMDYLTYLCPPARRQISRCLGMKMVDRRTKQADK